MVASSSSRSGGALSQTWGHLGVARNLNTSASWHTGEQASKEGKINKFMEGLHLITTCLWAKPNHKSSCKQTIQEHYFVLLTRTVVFKSRSSSKHCKELIVIVLINRMHFSTTLYSFATGRLNQVPKKKKQKTELWTPMGWRKQPCSAHCKWLWLWVGAQPLPRYSKCEKHSGHQRATKFLLTSWFLVILDVIWKGVL